MHLELVSHQLTELDKYYWFCWCQQRMVEGEDRGLTRSASVFHHASTRLLPGRKEIWFLLSRSWFVTARLRSQVPLAHFASCPRSLSFLPEHWLRFNRGRGFLYWPVSLVVVRTFSWEVGELSTVNLPSVENGLELRSVTLWINAWRYYVDCGTKLSHCHAYSWTNPVSMHQACSGDTQQIWPLQWQGEFR